MTLTLGMLEVRSSQFSGCFGMVVRQFSRHRYHEQYLLGMYQECAYIQFGVAGYVTHSLRKNVTKVPSFLAQNLI